MLASPNGGPGVSLTLWCFVVYSTRRFVVCLTMCHFVRLFTISSSFGDSGRLYVMIVTYPGYLYLYHYENMPIQIY